jgi:hypothetical protein
MNKWNIEVTEDSAMVSVTLGEKTFTENWIRTEYGCKATNKGISSQLEDANYEIDDELEDAISGIDVLDLMNALVLW